ncbi:hypothetical protein Pyn_22721 [Prunus yedoensis var. nudiflora]|uniref:Uncharacterized protein n=1 Tax=Prunus yedoensis var. nudiflora TaxID=2094558 RepID=A0A314ZH86_PRUYE|nr:hypothetical protein Pyn_22721 [Prunus yedoensis var. nudiflora]
MRPKPPLRFLLPHSPQTSPYRHKSPKPLQQFRHLSQRTGTCNRLPPSKGHLGGLEEGEGSGTLNDGRRHSQLLIHYFASEKSHRGEERSSICFLGLSRGDLEMRRDCLGGNGWRLMGQRVEGGLRKGERESGLLARVEGGEELGFWVHGA